jgi:hypothetical protein
MPPRGTLVSGWPAARWGRGSGPARSQERHPTRPYLLLHAVGVEGHLSKPPDQGAFAGPCAVADECEQPRPGPHPTDQAAGVHQHQPVEPIAVVGGEPDGDGAARRGPDQHRRGHAGRAARAAGRHRPPARRWTRRPAAAGGRRRPPPAGCRPARSAVWPWLILRSSAHWWSVWPSSSGTRRRPTSSVCVPSERSRVQVHDQD